MEKSKRNSWNGKIVSNIMGGFQHAVTGKNKKVIANLPLLIF
jgi:hypothetical protein